jgi:hypothetical protein
MYIASYDDKELVKLGLTLDDAYFLEWLINFKDSNRMLKLPDDLNEEKEHDYYWITYTKVIKDLPLLYLKNNTSINAMLNRLSGKNKSNYNEYPLIRQKVNINLVNKSFVAIRPEVIAKMKGVQYTDGLFDEGIINKLQPKQETKKSLGQLLPNTEKILIELDKLRLPDNRKLFSFTFPTDHKIYTKSMKKFQDALYDLYEGRYLSRHKLADWFIEKNISYITNETIKEINRCKGNWNQIYMVLKCSAKNYLSWFENDRESENKNWLTRDIGSFMFNPINNSSMFYITILKKASKTREVIAESIYNKVPEIYKNYFEELYNSDWDGLAYWTRVYSVHTWYRDNADDLIAENINYKYCLEDEDTFIHSYYDFLNSHLGIKHLKHFGAKCPTWKWFMDEMKEQHGIDE